MFEQLDSYEKVTTGFLVALLAAVSLVGPVTVFASSDLGTVAIGAVYTLVLSVPVWFVLVWLWRSLR